MDSTTDLTLRALDQPLPAELTGRNHGWFTRYRTYPVFSRPWVQGRARTVGPVAVIVFLLLLAGAMLPAPGDKPLGGMAQFALNLLLPLFAGPWLAFQVRRRQWTPQQEWWGLVGVFAALVLALAAFNEWGAEPMKQRIAEATGMVDASGKRKKVVIALGMTIRSPDDAAAAPQAEKHTEPDNPSRAASRVTFALLAFWLAGGGGLWAWRRERAGLAALAQERALARAQGERREAEMRLSVLAAQVEPHFLFNTLAGVRSAIATDPGRASDMIDRLVDYLRAAIPRLRSDGAVQATLGAQLDIVRAYLGLMAARMPRLRYSAEAPVDLLNTPCPPLMLISLVENAVKHGVEPKIGPSRVDVSARRTGDGRLEVTVADDGAGFGATPTGSGLGLANIRERLQQMYQGRASLVLKARPEGGVAATLSLPLE
jgi:signal transduction histidine kinase